MSAAVPPVGNAPIGAGYGPYPGGPLFGRSMHTGIDFEVPDGTPVHANRSALVIFAGWDTTGYGNCIKTLTGNGTNQRITCIYGHLSKINVTIGQTVHAGDVIASTGHSGDATGPHLHFGVELNGQFVNPAPYVSGEAGISGQGGGVGNEIGTIAGAVGGGLLGGVWGVGKGAAVGGAVGNAGQTAVDAASGAASAMDAVGSFLGKLGDGKTWVRVLQVLGGAGLIVGGVVIVGRSVIGDTAIAAIPGGAALAAASGK